MFFSLWNAIPCHSTSSTPISPSATPSASRCRAPVWAISRSIRSCTRSAKSSSFWPQMSRYSWRELASPQNEYQTDNLRGLAGEMLERRHQHRRLGVEVEPHDARGQTRERHHAADGGARGAIDVQR